MVDEYGQQRGGSNRTHNSKEKKRDARCERAAEWFFALFQISLSYYGTHVLEEKNVKQTKHSTFMLTFAFHEKSGPSRAIKRLGALSF